MMSRLTETQRAHIEYLREQGIGHGGIARLVGCGPGAVAWHCLRYGIEPLRPLAWPSIPKPAIQVRGGRLVRAFSPAEDTRLLALALGGASPHAIGRRLGRAESSVRARLMILARRDARAEAA